MNTIKIELTPDESRQFYDDIRGEAVRNAIVGRRAAEYQRRATEYEHPTYEEHER
jgi:hypothetical protein